MMVLSSPIIVRVLAALILGSALSACSTVPFDYPKSASTTYTDTLDTAFGESLQEWTDEHPGLSGFYPLNNGMDALGARLRIIEAAERSIDAQYFLMKDDSAGEVIAGALLDAADRDVRVRFLLDDVFTTVDDDILALLNQHPNIELRLYNPISRRGIYYFNYAADFSRANRRMHSKSLTADNAITIVGGRNIADEYFQLRDDAEFLDFDVLALGPIAAEVSEQFDDFWNSDRALPMEALHIQFTEEDLHAEQAEIDEERAKGQNSIYSKAINTQYLMELIDGSGTLHPAPSRLLYDGAAKLENPIDESQMTVVAELANIIAEAQSVVFIITPYFIPTNSGLTFWQQVLDRGVALTVVTNSLASTNHVPVHAGYSRYRKQMLAMGAELYEARADAVAPVLDDEIPVGLTLHTKLMVIDERYFFVGSLNMDPRSLRINAEMGLLIDAPVMARKFIREVEQDLAAQTYKLVLDEKNDLSWHATVNGENIVETKEPLTSRWRRFLAWIYRVLPESQL